MSAREPKRLDDLPDSGRVLVAHPDREQQAIAAAREQLCDYFLSPNGPLDGLYLLNCDQLFAPPLSNLWWTADGDLVERWRIRGT